MTIYYYPRTGGFEIKPQPGVAMYTREHMEALHKLLGELKEFTVLPSYND